MALSLYHAAAVRFGQPGFIWIAAASLAADASVTTVSSAPSALWYPAGYTDTGSQWSYNVSTANVEVAEELDPLARAITGRDGSVTFALAETTYRNVQLALNGGLLTTGSDGTNWTLEPPALSALATGNRIAILWDAVVDTATSTTSTTNPLRLLFRQNFQTGSVGYENRKGATKSVIPMTYGMEVPSYAGVVAGTKTFKIFGGGTLNPAL